MRVEGRGGEKQSDEHGGREMLDRGMWEGGEWEGEGGCCYSSGYCIGSRLWYWLLITATIDIVQVTYHMKSIYRV